VARRKSTICLTEVSVTANPAPLPSDCGKTFVFLSSLCHELLGSSAPKRQTHIGLKAKGKRLEAILRADYKSAEKNKRSV
jgi:hypothetical protein